MHILIIEDDAYWQNQLKQQLLQIQFDLNIDLDVEMMDHLDISTPISPVDLILMDIEIGQENSLQHYQQIFKTHPTVLFCYVTSHTDYMTEAFGVNVCGYVIKSDLSKLKQILVRVLKIMEEKGRWFDTIKGKQLIQYHDILYFSSINKKIYLYTVDEEIRLTVGSIASLLESLPSYFVLINKQEIINLDKITFISRDRLDLKGKRMPFVVSRRKYNEVIALFMKRVKEGIR